MATNPLVEEAQRQRNFASPNNTFPGNRLQGNSGSGGAPRSLVQRAGLAETEPAAASSAPQSGGNSFGDASAAANNSAVTQIPARSLMQRAGLAGVSQPGAPGQPIAAATTPGIGGNFMPGTRAVYNESGKAINDLAGQGRYGAAAGEAVRGMLAYAPAVADDLVGGAVRAVAQGLADAGKQFLGLNGADAPAQPAPVQAATTPTPSQAAPQSRPLMQAAFDGASAPSSPGTVAPSQSAGNVTRQGNSYSGSDVAGDITINGQAPRGGQVSAQNMAAGNNLAGRQGLASYAASQPPAASTGTGVPLVQAAGIRHSGNDWQSRNELRNSAVSANSIMNTRRWGGPGAENNPAVQEYRAMLGTDQALRQSQPGMDVAAMRENAGLQREGMQQSGANRRSLMSNMLDQEKLGMERETRGFANRASAQQEQLRDQVEQERDPAKRRGLVQHMLDVSGKTQQADPYLVVQGGQQVDENGRPYNMPSSVFNRQTGQFVQQPSPAGIVTVSSPSQLTALPSGTVYVAPDGKQYRKN